MVICNLTYTDIFGKHILSKEMDKDKKHTPM
jgi:hypothetical protein